jgi:methylphosphotriester-DNA--protein-cysteine methyltransferase
MSANPSPDDSKVLKALSEQQKDALLGEVLGDVLKLHESVKDLTKIIRDADERTSARVVDLLKVSSDFAHAREAAFAEIGVQARTKAQQAFVEAMGDRLTRLDHVVHEVPRTIGLLAQRRFSELVAVSVATGFVTCVSTLVGMWLMTH